jgi:hypothetical protein
MGGLLAIASGSECGISWNEPRRSIGVGRHLENVTHESELGGMVFVRYN